jgi:hypothetical protein
MKRLMEANLDEIESVEQDERGSDFRAQVQGEDVAD